MRGEREASSPELEWVSYARRRTRRFGRCWRRLTSESLDMPELEGIRSLDDVLVGHRASGRFVPEYWLLGRLPGEPEAMAVMLLSGRSFARSSWEVAYLGLTPAARGRGLGHGRA